MFHTPVIFLSLLILNTIFLGLWYDWSLQGALLRISIFAGWYLFAISSYGQEFVITDKYIRDYMRKEKH